MVSNFVHRKNIASGKLVMDEEATIFTVFIPTQFAKHLSPNVNGVVVKLLKSKLVTGVLLNAS